MGHLSSARRAALRTLSTGASFILMGDVQLVFGWRTALLGMLSLQMVALAVALAGQPINQTANRTLSAFLIVATGVVTPYTIGFAGFYDAWMGLTFAPFALTLFLAPLLYGYTHALITGVLPDRWRWHLAPGFGQVAYMTTAFLLPLDVKLAWADLVDGPWVSRTISIGVLVGLVAYSAAALRLLSRFRSGLADQRSDDDRYSSHWLGRILAAMAAIALLWTGWQAWQALSGFDYFEFFGLHLAIGAIGVLLGAEGWRHAGLRFARMRENAAAESGLFENSVPDAAEPDWAVIGAGYAAKTREAGWWREPDLSLPRLARLLGTNTGRVSRTCRTRVHVDLSAVRRVLGDDYVLWGKTSRCKVWVRWTLDRRCEGKVTFLAQSSHSGTAVPLRMTGLVRDTIQLRSQAAAYSR